MAYPRDDEIGVAVDVVPADGQARVYLGDQETEEEEAHGKDDQHDGHELLVCVEGAHAAEHGPDQEVEAQVRGVVLGIERPVMPLEVRIEEGLDREQQHQEQGSPDDQTAVVGGEALDIGVAVEAVSVLASEEDGLR